MKIDPEAEALALASHQGAQEASLRRVRGILSANPALLRKVSLDITEPRAAGSTVTKTRSATGTSPSS